MTQQDTMSPQSSDWVVPQAFVPLAAFDLWKHVGSFMMFQEVCVIRSQPQVGDASVASQMGKMGMRMSKNLNWQKGSSGR